MKVTPNLYSVELTKRSLGWSDDSESSYNELASMYAKYDFITVNPYIKKDAAYSNFVDSPLIMSDAQLLELSIDNINFKVLQKINVQVDITQQLIELSEKPIKITQESNSGDVNYNTRCEVHMPNMAMSMYNEMLLLEDACTDILQRSLNSGWRIIAACPQPDQRRPDYILGRFNPDYDADGSARRSN